MACSESRICHSARYRDARDFVSGGSLIVFSGDANAAAAMERYALKVSIPPPG